MWISPSLSLTGQLVRLEPLSLDHTDALIDAVHDGNLHTSWWTSTPGPDTTFYDLSPAIPRLEIGYTWTRASAQGTGTNPDSKLQLLTYAFEELGCQCVGIRTKWSNQQSRTAIERLGFKRDGVLRAHTRLRNGALDDAVLYSALPTEWPAIKARLETRVERHVSNAH